MLVLRKHGKVAWVVPEYRNSRPLWRWVMATCRASDAFTINKSEKTIETKRGGLLAIYSADNPSSILGEGFHLVIVDEAARVDPEVIHDTLHPTLSDFDGEMVLISTPRGQNWFYDEWLKGQGNDPRYFSKSLPTSLNPNPHIQNAFRLAKERVPDRTYRQEWLAEFIADGSGVFRNIEASATGAWQDGPIEGHNYLIGADWGRANDYTVFMVVDLTLHAVVHFDRSNEVEYKIQRGRLEALYRRFGAIAVIAESNAMGEPIIEELSRASIPVQPFQTTNATKQSAIDGLALAFEQGTIILPTLDAPNMGILISELKAYTSERLPSGLIRYGAPSGKHDDTVMALALAWHGCSQQYEPAFEVEYAEPYTFSNSDY